MGQTCGEVRCSRPNGKLVSVGRAAQAHKKLSDGRPHRSFAAVRILFFMFYVILLLRPCLVCLR